MTSSSTSDLTQSAPPDSAPARQRPALVARDLALCAALAVVPYLWRLAMGTRRFPNDDSWAYVRIFDVFHNTGHIELVDWNDITLVGVLPVTELWVRIVGYGPLQVHLAGSLMGFVSLWALRSILRTFGCARVPFVLTVFGASMGFVATTGTFMADLFALAGSLVSFAVAAHVVAGAERRAAWLYGLIVVSSGAAVYAFTVRQQTVVAAGAVALVLLLAGRRIRLGWLVFGGVYSVAIVPFYVWRSGIENGGSAILSFEPRAIVAGAVVLVLMVALSLLPVIVATHGLLLSRAVPLRVAGSALAAAAMVAYDPSGRIVDSLSIVFHLAASSGVVRAVGAVVLVNVLVTVGVAIASIRLPDVPLVRATALSAVLVLVADLVITALGSGYYSRYSLFFLALALAVLSVSGVGTPPSTISAHRTASWVVLGVVAATSLWTLDRDLAGISADLEGAAVAECAGVPLDEIDAGFVWMGLHDDDIAVARYTGLPWIDDGLPPSWHHRIFPDAERVVVVTPDRPDDDGVVVVDHVTETGFLPGNSAERWVVVRDEDSDLLDGCIDG